MHNTTQNVLFYVILAKNILYNIFTHFYSGVHRVNESKLITAYLGQKSTYLAAISTFFTNLSIFCANALHYPKWVVLRYFSKKHPF